MATLAKLMVSLGLDSGEFSGGLNKAAGETEKFAGALGGLGKAALGGTAIAGAALAGLAVAGTNSFMSFQKGMAEVFTLMPTSSQASFDKMTTDVQQFAIKFGVLPEKVIPGLYQALSSGVPPGNVFDFLTTAQTAATAGVTDLMTTVDGLTSVINAYGASSITAAQASDQMFTAVVFGKTTFEELSHSLYNVNPIAASLGISFGDVTSAIAAMTAQGVPTAQTTTQLRQMMVELGDSTSQAGKIFQGIAGTGFKQFISAGGNVQGALQLMEGAANSSGKGINELFGSVEAGSAALALTGKGTQLFSDALAATANSTGSTAKAFETMNSTLSATMDKLKAAGSVFLTLIGSALAPALGVLANGLLKIASSQGAIEFVSAFGNALAATVNLVIAFGSSILGLVKMAFGWGNNIGMSFTDGIISAGKALVAALQQIGAIIAHWLRPGSPPKITPELDQWGIDAATVYFDGWAKGDMSAFSTMASALQSTLNGLVSNQKFPKEGVIPTMLAGRSGLQQLFSELAKTGDVTQATFDKMIASMGPAGSKIAGVVRAYIDLSKATKAVDSAQSELNATTSKYSAILAPMNKQMKALQDRDEEIKDMQRVEELNKTLGDSKSTEADKELARNEIAEINLKHQINGVEAERDASVEAAQQKLDAAKTVQDAAQKSVDAQQAQIDSQNQTNDLIGQQIQLMDQMSKAAKGAGGGAGGGLGGLGAGGLPDMGGGLTTAMQPIADLNAGVTQLKDDFVATTQSANTMATSVGGAFSSIMTMLAPVMPVLMAYAQVWINLGMTIYNVAVALSSGDIAGAWQALITGLGSVVTAYQTYLDTLYTVLSGVGVWLATNLPIWGQAFVDWITPYIPIALGMLNILIVGISNWVLSQIPVLVAMVTQWGNAFIAWIVPALPAMVLSLVALANGLLTWISAQAAPIVAQLLLWGNAFIAWIVPATIQFLAAWPTMLNSFLDWIGGAVAPLLAQLGTWAIAFIAWILPMLPGFIVAIGAIAAAILIWIGETVVTLSVKLLEWAVAMIAWIAKEVLPKLPAELSTIIGALTGWITQQIGPLNSQILAWANVLLDWVKNDVIPSLPGKLEAIITSVKNWITGAVSTVTTEAAKLGKGLIDGVVKAVTDGASRVYNAVSNAISNALGQSQSDNGVHSPSTVWADKLGTPLILGVIEGMNNTMPQVLEWVKGNLGKKLAAYLNTTASFVRGNLDVFKSLQTLEKVDPYQPLTDSVQKLQEAQKSSLDISQKLDEANQKIADFQASTGLGRGQLSANVADNQKLADLYKTQADLLQQQADAQQKVADATSSNVQAQYISDYQAQQIKYLAQDTQKQYSDLETQAQALMKVDATRALQFYNDKKKQIEELASLEKQRIQATDTETQNSLDTEIALTKAAQQAETAAQTATINIQNAGGTSDTGDAKILDIINQALKAAGIKTDVKYRTA